MEAGTDAQSRYNRKEARMFPKLMKRPEVEAAVGLSTASIYRLMDGGEFPRPIRIGQRAVRWKAADLQAWLESRPETKGSA